MKLSNEAKKLIKNKIVRIYGGDDSHGHYWCADAELNKMMTPLVEEKRNQYKKELEEKFGKELFKIQKEIQEYIEEKGIDYVTVNETTHIMSNRDLRKITIDLPNLDNEVWRANRERAKSNEEAGERLYENIILGTELGSVDAENIDRMIEESMNKILAEFNSAK